MSHVVKRRDRVDRVDIVARAAMAVLVVVLVVVFSTASPWYLTADNLTDLVTGIAAAGILAVPMTFLIMTGHLDLSVGAAMACVGVLTATLSPDMAIGAAVLLGGLAGVVIGACNGLLVTIGGVSSIIATFAVMTLLRGVATLIPSGLSTSLTGFRWLGHAEPLPGVPVLALVFLVLTATAIVLSRGAAGRRSRMIGVRLRLRRPPRRGDRRWVTMLFLISGAAAAIAGLHRAAQLGTGLPSAGLGVEVTVITAVLLGGGRLSGGRGSVGGTLLALTLIIVIDNGISVSNITPYAVPVIHAVLLVVALGISAPTRRGGTPATHMIWPGFVGHRGSRQASPRTDKPAETVRRPASSPTGQTASDSVLATGAGTTVTEHGATTASGRVDASE